VEKSTGPVGEPRRPSSDDVNTDMVRFGVGPDDLRVARGDWVYYVRVVPRGAAFLGGRTSAGSGGGDLVADGDLSSLALAVLLVVPLKLLGSFSPARTRPRAMKVGVVRVPDPRSWTVDRHRVVHRQRLARGEDPTPYVRDLAERAAAGEFAPQG